MCRIWAKITGTITCPHSNYSVHFCSPPIWLQFLILGTIVNLAFSSADVVCVFCADLILKKLKTSGRGQHIFRYLSGSIFIMLGLRLGLYKD